MRLSKKKIKKMSCEERIEAITIEKVKKSVHIYGRLIDGFIVSLKEYKSFKRPTRYWTKCSLIIFTEIIIYALLRFYSITKEYSIISKVIFVILLFYTIFFSFFLRFASAFSGNDIYNLGYKVEDFWPWIL